MKKINKALALTAVALGMTISSQAKPVVINGSLIDSESYGYMHALGSDGSISKIATNNIVATGGGVYFDGYYFFSRAKGSMALSNANLYNTDTGTESWKSVYAGADNNSYTSTDFAYDLDEDVLYGFYNYSASNYGIGKISNARTAKSVEDLSRKYVMVQVGADMKAVLFDGTDASKKWHGMAFDAQNQLWVLTYTGGLYKVDKTNGEMTLVGETGILPTVNGSAAFDLKSGKLYWAAKTAECSAVYEVNTETAEAVKVIDVPDNKQFCGIYVAVPAAEDGAPAAAQDIAFNFENGSLEGTVSFTVANLSFDDQPLEGTVNYTVTVGTQEPVSGTAAYGATVSVPVEVAASGDYKVTVVLSNEAGNSPKAEKTGYIGYGVPATPANVVASYANGMLTLTWDAVTTAKDDKGYLGEVMYTVFSGTETVAEALSENSLSFALAEPEGGIASYSYTVKASNEEFTSAASAAASIIIGSLNVPYVNEFATVDDFNQFTVVNVEAGSNTWSWAKITSNADQCKASISFGPGKDYVKNDWLITAPVKLQKGAVYKVSVDAWGSKATSSEWEKFCMAWGETASAAGMHNEGLAQTDLTATQTNYSYEMTAPEDGNYYFGIHACSAAYMNSLYVDNFKIELVSLPEPPVREHPLLINGSLVDSESMGYMHTLGADGSVTKLPSPYYPATGGGAYFDGYYFINKAKGKDVSAATYLVNTETWKTMKSVVDEFVSYTSTDYSYDAEQGLVYGFHQKYSGSAIYVIGKTTVTISDSNVEWNRKTVQVQKGKDMVDVEINCTDPLDKWHGLAFDAQNQLWVLTFGGKLYTVDKTNGEMTLVGETGILPTVNGSATFDKKTGKLYWSVKNEDCSAVYEVNTETAEAVKVIDVPDNKQFCGIYVAPALAEDDAPAAVENLHYEFDGGALEGHVVFDVPAETYNFAAATGEVNYTVTVGSQEAVTGVANHGDKNVKVAVSVPESGDHEVTVHLENEAGKSPAVKHSAYIGHGKPFDPENVALTYEDGKMKLSWDAVTAVKDDKGHVGTITYTVSRKLAGVPEEVVAESLEDNSYEEEVAEPESGMKTYTYSVVAVNGDMKSAVKSSSSISLGTAALPYSNTFQTADDFAELTNINVETGSKAWTYSSTSKYASIGYDAALAKDDWLITPPLKLEAGYKYTVTVSAKSQNSSYKESIEVAWGDAPTAEAMTEIGVDSGADLVPTTWKDYEFDLEPPTDGLYYVGVHAMSPKDKSTLMVNKIAVDSGVETRVNVLAADKNACISVSAGVISVSAEGEAVIATADGAVVFAGNAAAGVAVKVPAGVYVVRAGNKTLKAVVK